MGLFDFIKDKVKGKNVKIVLPEGNDWRVLGAAIRLKEDGLVDPIVIGKEDEVLKLAKDNNKDASKLTIMDPAKCGGIDELIEKFVERRKGKIDEEGARKLLLEDPNYFGTMLVYAGKADGLVSGATRSTGDTVRPALQIIKMQPGYGKTSGVMIMIKDDEQLVFADVAITIAPEAKDLAETAILSAKTAKQFNIEPKVAMLSFSTKGSAASDEVTKVAEATKIAKENAPDLALDGEMQFDAAYVESVGKSKAPDSKVAGHANVFVFPSLEAGNIGYKIAQRLGGYEAVGPILQGLNAPVNDLSRGCSEEDVYKLSLITAAQALND
ncbi:phosphate acetyltransferase [Neofamilia massiliensis]|uniref:phosphate acetyltransferase n=1 Tax=Neofamilia massiliensis TaxID=1673724 RepID=UPI0006BB7B0C|nr:phosphate acetyltransferase [Neofamilia massiliensis]